MQYRKIAKQITHDMIKARTVTPEDGVTYGMKKPFTPKQIAKLQQAMDADRERLAKKLK